jgi:hypothetical protein
MAQNHGAQSDAAQSHARNFGRIASGAVPDAQHACPAISLRASA